MELIQLGWNEKVATLACEGAITRRDFLDLDNPLLVMLGEGCLNGNVLLDLQKAKAMDTMGVHWLASTHRRFEEAGGKLILHSLPPTIYYMLRFLGLDQVLHLAHNLTEGLALARGKYP